MSVAMFRAFLRLYPRDFRETYGNEMTLVFEDMRRDRSARRLWVSILLDTVTMVPRLQMEAQMKRNAVVIAGTAMLGIAVVGVVTGNFFIGGFILIGVAALFLIPAALLARRAKGGAEQVYAIRRWPFWTFPAVGIAVMYVLMGIGQLIREPKKENAFALVFFVVLSAMITRGLFLRRTGRVSGDWMIAAASFLMFTVFWLVWPPIVGSVVIVGAMTEALSVRAPRAA